MLRGYARTVGVGLLLLGGACMLGVGTTNPLVDLDHLFVGRLLWYAGSGDRDEEFAHGIVGGTGVIYLMAGALAWVVPALLSAPFAEIHNGILLNRAVHVAVGLSNVAAVGLFPQNPPVRR